MPAETEKAGLAITKKATDPEATRVSVGGRDGAFYCTYRGTVEEAITCLWVALRGLQSVRASGVEPDISPDDGKKYA